MPKRKADSWPSSILNDPDVLNLDDEGRFVLCKVCHVYYAVHGGKKPKPVIMNSCFRTRAWDVHKERTNSHRVQRNPQLLQQQQQHVAPGGAEGAIQNNEEQKKHDTEHQQQHKPGLKPHQQLPHDRPQQVLLQPSPPPLPPPPSLQHLRSTETQHYSPAIAHMNSHLNAPMEPKLPSPRRHVYANGLMTLSQSPNYQWPKHSELHCPNTERTTIPSFSSLSHKTNGKAPANSTQLGSMMRGHSIPEDVNRQPIQRFSDSDHSSNSNSANGLPSSSLPIGKIAEFGDNNEQAAKKLKSLNDEYDANAFRRPDVFNDQRSSSSKKYWGTLRNLYSAKKSIPHARSRNNYDRERSIADSTTPDDTGSSEDSTRPVVVHDQALINAIHRLTGVVSKQHSDRGKTDSSATIEALLGLTSAVTELQNHQDKAFERIIELQEQHLQVMEALLQHKVRKENRSRPGSRPQ